VNFGLQFEPSELAAETAAKNLPTGPASLPAATPVPAPDPTGEVPGQPAKPGDGAEVVRLDRFRKK
jgi:hypothetical protein